MSTISPPGSDWDAPDPGSGTDAPRRAAMFVWVTGGVEMLFFGCCALVMTAIHQMPLPQLQGIMAQQHQQLKPQDLARFYPLMLPFAVAMLVAGFLPGLAYLLLGFGVRSGRIVPIYAAMFLGITQIIVLGTVFVVGVVNALVIGNVQGVTVDVLLLGSLIALLLFTVRWLFRARGSAGAALDQNDQPWGLPPDQP